jgi:DNA-directed RNA polymerase specialized sigma24 family protein
VRNTILWHRRDGYTCDEIVEELSAATHRVKKHLVKGLAHCREPLS